MSESFIGRTAGFAAEAAAQEKHMKQDADCENRGRVCTDLAVETFGAWCEEGDQAMCKPAHRGSARDTVGGPESVISPSPGPCSRRTRAPTYVDTGYEFARPALVWGWRPAAGVPLGRGAGC